MSTIEYRKLFRADIVLNLRYHIKSAPLIEYKALSKNLSATGLQMIGDKLLDKETILELEIILPNTKPLYFLGSVVWQIKCDYTPPSKKNYYSTRVRFLHASSKDVIIISDFITNILKQCAADREKEIIDSLEKANS